MKLQTCRTGDPVTSEGGLAGHQRKTVEGAGSQKEMPQALELSEESHRELIEFCKESEIKFLSSAFDLGSIDFLADLGLRIFKVPSGEIANTPYLQRIIRLDRPVILSTGMATLGEVAPVLQTLEQGGVPREQLTLPQCNTEYPTSPGDVNLRVMEALRVAFPGIRAGFSDHTLGVAAPIAAAALRAAVLEKHFTLKRGMEGPDHQSSFKLDNFQLIVAYIREVEQALGSGREEPLASERRNISIARLTASPQIPTDL